jgi:hypothetical protein
MPRTANDWGNLVLAELDGREDAGTVSRILANITGTSPATDDMVRLRVRF